MEVVQAQGARGRNSWQLEHGWLALELYSYSRVWLAALAQSRVRTSSRTTGGAHSPLTPVTHRNQLVTARHVSSLVAELTRAAGVIWSMGSHWPSFCTLSGTRAVADWRVASLGCYVHRQVSPTQRGLACGLTCD